MSLHAFTAPPLPPDTPPLLPLNANTHAGVLPASASSNLASSQNAIVGNLANKCFVALPVMDALGDGKILGERGATDQTNSSPLFPIGLSMTSLPAEVDGTAECTVLEGAKGGAIFLTSLSSTQRAHNCHINSNDYIFF